jgi:hypothetical protein
MSPEPELSMSTPEREGPPASRSLFLALALTALFAAMGIRAVDRLFGTGTPASESAAEIEALVEGLEGAEDPGEVAWALQRAALATFGGAGARRTDTPTEGEAAAVLRSPETVAALVDLLGSEDAGVRATAADTLWIIGADDAAPALRAALKDPAPKVRGFAASALGGLGDAASVAALIALLEDEDAEVRARAASALGVIGDPVALEPVRALVERYPDHPHMGFIRLALAALEAPTP